MKKPKRGSYWQLTPEGIQPLRGHTPASTLFHSLLPLIPKRMEICMPGHPPPLYFSSHLPSPKMLNPPEQWAHWCWQDVRMQAEELGAALPSALASPSRVSWAFGQLGAFPGELELSLKLWPKRATQKQRLDEHLHTPRQDFTMHSASLPSSTHILLCTFLTYSYFQCPPSWIVSLSTLPGWTPALPGIFCGHKYHWIGSISRI